MATSTLHQIIDHVSDGLMMNTYLQETVSSTGFEQLNQACKRLKDIIKIHKERGLLTIQLEAAQRTLGELANCYAIMLPMKNIVGGTEFKASMSTCTVDDNPITRSPQNQGFMCSSAQQPTPQEFGAIRRGLERVYEGFHQERVVLLGGDNVCERFGRYSKGLGWEHVQQDVMSVTAAIDMDSHVASSSLPGCIGSVGTAVLGPHCPSGFEAVGEKLDAAMWVTSRSLQLVCKLEVLLRDSAVRFAEAFAAGSDAHLPRLPPGASSAPATIEACTGVINWEYNGHRSALGLVDDIVDGGRVLAYTAGIARKWLLELGCDDPDKGLWMFKSGKLSQVYNEQLAITTAKLGIDVKNLTEKQWSLKSELGDLRGVVGTMAVTMGGLVTDVGAMKKDKQEAAGQQPMLLEKKPSVAGPVTPGGSFTTNSTDEAGGDKSHKGGFLRGLFNKS